MPLDRVPEEQFDVLVDHADGPAGHSCSCGPTLLSVIYSKGLSCRPQETRAAGRPSVPRHVPEPTAGGTPWEPIVF
jgi:hypothetical protein